MVHAAYMKTVQCTANSIVHYDRIDLFAYTSFLCRNIVAITLHYTELRNIFHFAFAYILFCLTSIQINLKFILFVSSLYVSMLSSIFQFLFSIRLTSFTSALPAFLFDRFVVVQKKNRTETRKMQTSKHRKEEDEGEGKKGAKCLVLDLY